MKTIKTLLGVYALLVCASLNSAMAQGVPIDDPTTTASNDSLTAMSSTLGLDFSVGSNFSIGLSPLLGFGTGGFSYGLGISASYSYGKWGIGGGVGLGNFYTGCSASLSYRKLKVGFTQTHFSSSSSFHGTPIGPQSTGTISVSLGKYTFRIANDLLGDGEDRWRTTSAELSKGKYSIGTYVNTNYGKEDGGGTEIRSTPYWVLDKSHESFKNGEVYYSPLWLGVASKDLIYRVGFNHPIVQNYTQNLVHSRMSTPYYIDYRNKKLTPYGQFGTKNPYTLWNR